MHSAVGIPLEPGTLDPDAREAGALEPAACAPIAAMSADGGCAVVGDGRELRMLGGPALLDAAGVVGAAAVDAGIWIVTADRDGHRLHRFDRGGAAAGPAVALGDLGDDLAIAALRVGARRALLEGRRAVLVTEHDGELAVEALGDRARDRRVLIGGRGVAERSGALLAWRRRGSQPGFALPVDLIASTVVGGAMVLDGAAALIEVDRGGQRSALIYDLRRSEVKSRIRLGDAAILAVAERKGLVVLGRGSSLAIFDLRAGCCIAERLLAVAPAACAIDTQGSRLVVVSRLGQVSELGPRLTDLVAVAAVVAGAPAASPIADDEAPAAAAATPDAGDRPAEPRAPDAPEPTEPRAPDAPEPAEPRAPDPCDEPAGSRAPDALDEAAHQVLHALAPASPAALTPDAVAAYLGDVRAWVDSLCDTVASAGASNEAQAAARERERAATERMARWNRSDAPHAEIARELGLSPIAITVLLLVAAPQIWGELARSYGRCAADPARPLVDELLLAHLLDAGTAARVAIAGELDDDAPLVASGAVEIGRGLRPYAALSVHPAIARRIAGGLRPGRDDAALALSGVIGPRTAIAALAGRLAAARPAPVRVVLRGRPGTGRRTLAAALAAQARRRIAAVAIDAAASDLEAVVRRRLRDAWLRGDLPCVGLDDVGDDPVLRARLRGVLDAHPGPLVVRAPAGGDLPLAPGYLALELPPLSETERARVWRELLAADRAPADAARLAASLAARFAVGPGAMIRACREIAGPDAGSEPALAAALRQHRSARIEAVATRSDALAGWDDLVVPDDIADALREICARVQHRRLVLEGWGMQRAAATAQGVTALFQGGPGTGKTMAAGVIARALGYELWRVDLSRVVSKWIGETEKNLAAVFDAAEQGEIVLLFDEADSLFAKRTQVTSSHDRNANLETNYLLQRLDSFTGIAVLTTNAGTAIDTAFKRRMSVHVQFPFPDEADRERLWRAHLPASLPVAGPLELGPIARKHQLSGGYIRNACLRAAYLAAGDGCALTEHHLHRAVALEYQRAGKLADGRLE